jgi:hypothetical protein
MTNKDKPHVSCTLAPGKQRETDSPQLRARSEEDERKLGSGDHAEPQADGDPEPTRYLAEQARQGKRGAVE